MSNVQFFIFLIITFNNVYRIIDEATPEYKPIEPKAPELVVESTDEELPEYGETEAPVEEDFDYYGPQIPDIIINLRSQEEY